MSKGYRRWKETEKSFNKYVTDEGMSALTGKTTFRRYRQNCRNRNKWGRRYKRELKSGKIYMQCVGNRDKLKQWGIVID